MNVCCLIVTYNRKKLLCRCLEKCLNQSIKPDIYIFDNYSTDGTKELLSERGYLANKRITYFLADKNGGGSYGFCNGLKACFKKGYEYFWLLDDDGYPEDSVCLEQCISCIKKNENTIVNALVHDESYLTFEMLGCNKVDEFEKKVNNSEVVFGVASPFNGTLISKSTIEKIGFPMGNFFVSGDETEYMLRALKNGVQIATLMDALYYHPRHFDNRIKIPFLSYYVPQMPKWRIYCRSRNYTFIHLKYSNFLGLMIFWAKDIIKCLFQKEDRLEKFKVLLIGYKDGYKNAFSIEKVKSYM